MRNDTQGVLEYNYVITWEDDECDHILHTNDIQYGINVSVIEAVNVIYQFSPDAEQIRTSIDALMQTGECHMVIWYL